jgi:VanZ family protein
MPGILMLLVFAVLIAYGSLYPFHFAVPLDQIGAWSRLFEDWSPKTSMADVLGNVALFVPFGAAAVSAFTHQRGRPFRTVAIAATAFAFALTLQIIQIYVPARTASLADVIWNMVGTGVGAIAGSQLHARGTRWQMGPVLPLGLIALWLAAELLPFVPTLDIGLVKTNIKPLLQLAVTPKELVFHAVGLIVVGAMLSEVVGVARSPRWLAALAGVVAVGQMVVVTRTLDISTLLGLAFGWITWWVLRRWPEERRSIALMLLLFGAYLLGSLIPFELRSEPQPFRWVPFAALLNGSMVANSKVLAANAFLFAGMLTLVRLNRGSPVGTSVALAIVVALCEATQTYLQGRTPDITEPIVVLMIGLVIRFMPLPTDTRSRSVQTPTPETVKAGSPVLHGKHETATGFKPVTWGIRLAIVSAAMALPLKMVLALPQLPYNVAELFLGGGAFPVLMIFALALLWVGAGARVIGHYVGVIARRPYLALPVLAFSAGVVSLMLLSASVSRESIEDISGSNNLFWFVTNKDVWGESARRLFLLIGSPHVIAFFEGPVRYACLYGPLVTFVALMYAGIEMYENGRLLSGRAVPLVASAFLWLWLCKAIAFDWSSTDNLTELIARDGEWGWGGGGYLYALLGLICANAVLLARLRITVPRSLAAALITLTMVPIGWWLINLGLAQNIEKYGSVFSGVQFLLGPDRQHLLDPGTLFLRWSVVQVAGVLVIALGARIAQPVIAWRTRRGIRELFATPDGATREAIETASKPQITHGT